LTKDKQSSFRVIHGRGRAEVEILDILENRENNEQRETGEKRVIRKRRVRLKEGTK